MKPFGLAEIRSGDLARYTSAYIDSIDDVTDFVKNLDGIKTALHTSDLKEAHDLVRVSAVLSDLTTLTLAGGTSLSATIRLDGSQRVTLPVAYLEKYHIDPQNPKIRVGVLLPDEEPYKTFIRDCLPLFERGSLVLRPARFVMFQVGEHNWHGVPAEADASKDTWIVSGESQSLGEIPVRLETDSTIPFDLALPYLRGIPFSELIKILEDAGDTILNLRRGIQKGIAERPVGDAKNAAQFRRDVIDPEIEALQRTFKKAVASHKYTMGGAVIGVVSLSLSAILSDGATSVISGLLGAGGLGLVAKDYAAFQAKLQDMKDHPYYLFWRAKYH